MLARTSLAGGQSDHNVARAYLWFSMALEQLTRAKNNVKNLMTAAQLSEAERKFQEQLNRRQSVEKPHAGLALSGYVRRVVA